MTTTLILDSLFLGGTELNAVRTVEALARRSIRVNVLHFHADGPLLDRLRATGQTVVHTPTAPLQSPQAAVRAFALARTLTDLGTSVVHAQDLYSNVFSIVASRLLSRRPVITSRRWLYDVPRPGLIPINAWAHRRSTLVLPNSRRLTEVLTAEGVRRDRIVVHTNFVDDAALSGAGAPSRAAWRSAVGVPVDAFVVGCVARLSAVKRHDVLLEAFGLTRQAIPHAHLVLVGDGEQRGALEERARELGVAAHVSFLGALPHQPLAAALFDVCCLLSDNEGFPNALVEASAVGVPIVGTPVGGVPDVLIDEVTGLAVPVGDAAATAAALIRLGRDAELRARYGAAGRELVLQSFSESAAIDRLIGIYDAVRAGIAYTGAPAAVTAG
jgi:glycosyltransferase involved in cell wall biosynthesis